MVPHVRDWTRPELLSAVAWMKRVLVRDRMRSSAVFPPQDGLHRARQIRVRKKNSSNSWGLYALTCLSGRGQRGQIEDQQRLGHHPILPLICDLGYARVPIRRTLARAALPAVRNAHASNCSLTEEYHERGFWREWKASGLGLRRIGL